MDILRYMCTVLGGVTLCVFAVGLLEMLREYILDRIKQRKWRHKYEHRFDKPPTAKCYCKDCKHHGSDMYENECSRFVKGWHTADHWFCWEADPRTSDPEAQE